MSDECISPLRRRMIEDMTVRKFTLKTQNDYIRVVKNFMIRYMVVAQFMNELHPMLHG